jgi:hypothetical protein
MGCASALWRCRRSIRYAAAADAHLRLLHGLPRWRAPLPDGPLRPAGGDDRWSCGCWTRRPSGKWRQTRPLGTRHSRRARRRLGRASAAAYHRRRLAPRRRQPSWQVARSSGSTPTGATASSDPSRARMYSCTSARCRPAAADLAGRPGRRVRHRAGTKGTSGRQCATTAGTRVGMTRPSACQQVSGLNRCGIRCHPGPMPPEPVGGSSSLGVIADNARSMRIGAGRCMVTPWWTGRAGGRDGDGRPEAAVRAAVAGLPGRPRPAPQLQGRHGVVPQLRPALAAGLRSSLALARPSPAVGPGGQRAGRVPLPRRPYVRGAAGGDRGGPLRTEPAATLAGSTTARDLATLPARRRGLGAHGLPLRWACLGALWSRCSDCLNRSRGAWR